MTQLDTCYQLLAEASADVAATIPPDRARVLQALLRAGDSMDLADEPPQAGRPGWKLALRLSLERQHSEDGNVLGDRAMLAVWAERFLADCDALALASLALARCESGQLQLQQRTSRTFVAWATSRRPSTEQREGADFDWWSALCAQRVASRMATLLAERQRNLALLDRKCPSRPESASHATNDPTVEQLYRQLGQAHVARFSPQHSYPSDAAIGGATFGRYSDILALLIAWLHYERDYRSPVSDDMHTPQNERDLITTLADALDADPAAIERALQPLIFDRDNAAYHSAIPGRAAPPLIRLDEERVVWSALGLLSEPLLFLSRELRRRHAQEYHNSAHLREAVFRGDLYKLFSDRRFDVSAGRVELKRSGMARTDLDALVFDRKTGTLGVFELKAQDPFARSIEERRRQRDNFLRANRQVSAILAWVGHHGPNDLLARFDERAAKRFRVQKVYVFVLGRYLAHLSGGPEPDRRVAWGSWPQVLRIVGDGPFDHNARNPLGTIFARLRDATPPSTANNADSKVIAVGGLRLHLYPSFTDMRLDEERQT
ncbi:MAG: hypothetical protein M3506_08170 [Chloroflexota bacterium]|nr:hypothetical protein [Chloroflexota bacterium]